MAIAAVASVYDCFDTSAAGTGATSSAIDTTGANLIVIVATYDGSPDPTVSDSKGNTYTALTKRSEGVLSAAARIYYCENPSVGGSHTFTFSTASASYTTLRVRAYSGAHASAQFDQESGAAASQPGSLTPSVDGCLVVCGGLNLFADDYAISQVTMRDQAGDIGSQTVGGFYADEIQTTATARNPTQSNPGGGGWPSYASVMAVFKPAAGGGGGAAVKQRMLLTGVGM